MSDQTLSGEIAAEEQAEEIAPTHLARRTEKFRGQHNVLVYLAQELDSLSRTIQTLADAQHVRNHLNHFAGKLVVHLAKEDKSLYPKLLESTDTHVVVLTRRFIREMGDLSATFDAYTKRWVGPANILERKDDFQTETAAIISALGERIDRENNELYTLADALPEA